MGVITVVVAGIAGASSSLIAPWAKYGVDRRQARSAERRRLIASWRELIAENHKPVSGNSRILAGFCPIIDDPRFLSLRPHLSAQLVSVLHEDMGGGGGDESTTIVLGARPGLDPVLNRVAEAVDDLERDWKLV